MSYLSFLKPGPIGAAQTALELSYPFTQDKNFPGAAESRHARALALRKAIQDNPQATGTSFDGSPSTLDYLKQAYGWASDPYGVNKADAAAPPAPPTSAAPAAHAAAPPPPPVQAPDVAQASQPDVPALGGLGLFPPQQAEPPNWLRDAQLGPRGFPPGMPLPQPTRPPQASSPVPMPMARPAEAPQEQPDMGFFARNTAMMQDPMTGQFIDPSAAQRAQVRGPDLINKMMAYLHGKDIG